jgi:hypothetical protein
MLSRSLSWVFGLLASAGANGNDRCLCFCCSAPVMRAEMTDRARYIAQYVNGKARQILLIV